jgi:hypothetical protein
MAKLFLFAVGGTGSRVLKAFTMLLASGVKLNASEVIPIIVDPHKSNEDLKRTINLLNSYQRIYDHLGDNREGFFSSKITTLKELVPNADSLPENFSFNLKDVTNLRFKNYIDYANLDPANQALASVLFSEDNLETDMDIGFVGNPNIGSVVLNQFKDSKEFESFASNFEENDRIFIISSIFGGTGAAGFPIILKNIRNAEPPIPNHGSLNDAKIGAITIMPYFGVEPVKDNPIKKAEFIAKTKAALAYYQQNVSGNKSVNALYYIGDDNTRDYQNDPGENGQKNDAHFIELASALAIFDFMACDDMLLATSNAQAQQPLYKDFGIKEDGNSLNFNMISDETQKLIMKPLCKYMMFVQFLENYLDQTIGGGQPFAERVNPKIDSAFLSSPFYNNFLKDFNRYFLEWIDEMAQNKRAFRPFDLKADKLSGIIDGIQPKKRFFSSGGFHYKTFISKLNAYERKQEHQTAAKKFIAVFNGATDALLEKYYAQF